MSFKNVITIALIMASASQALAETYNKVARNAYCDQLPRSTAEEIMKINPAHPRYNEIEKSIMNAMATKYLYRCNKLESEFESAVVNEQVRILANEANREIQNNHLDDISQSNADRNATIAITPARAGSLINKWKSEQTRRRLAIR